MRILEPILYILATGLSHGESQNLSFQYKFWDARSSQFLISHKSLSLLRLTVFTLNWKCYLSLLFRLTAKVTSDNFKDFNINHILCITLSLRHSFIHWFQISKWDPTALLMTTDVQIVQVVPSWQIPWNWHKPKDLIYLVSRLLVWNTYLVFSLYFTF